MCNLMEYGLGKRGEWKTALKIECYELQQFFGVKVVSDQPDCIKALFDLTSVAYT